MCVGIGGRRKLFELLLRLREAFNLPGSLKNGVKSEVAVLGRRWGMRRLYGGSGGRKKLIGRNGRHGLLRCGHRFQAPAAARTHQDLDSMRLS